MTNRKTVSVKYVSGLKFEGDPALGLSYGDFVIEVDKKLKGRKLFEILIHEILHELWPEANEEEIEFKAAVLTRTLWREGFRRVDNIIKEKLQDE